MNRSFGLLAATFAAVFMVAGYVNSCVAAEAEPFVLVSGCVDDVAAKRAEFNDPGDKFGVTDTFDAVKLEAALLAMNAPPAMAADHASRAAFLVMATSPVYPPGQVYFAAFDADRCFLGQGRPSLATIYLILGDDLPIPEPSDSDA